MTRTIDLDPYLTAFMPLFILFLLGYFFTTTIIMANHWSAYLLAVWFDATCATFGYWIARNILRDAKEEDRKNMERARSYFGDGKL